METNNDHETHFSELSDTEKEIVLNWAKEVRAIQKDKSLTTKNKIKALSALNNSKAFKSTSKLMLMHSKRYWKNSSWSERLGIIGGGGALVLFGAAGSGIAALGGAVGIPFFLVTAAGGTLIGTIIDKLDNR